MQKETLKNKTDSNHSKEIGSEIIIIAREDVVQEKIVMIEIRTDTDKTTDQETVATTKTTADNTLFIWCHFDLLLIVFKKWATIFGRNYCF